MASNMNQSLKLKAESSKFSSKSAASQPKKALVQEVVTESVDATWKAASQDVHGEYTKDSTARASSTTTSGNGAGGSSKGPPLIKKGFLNTAKEKGVSLYPESGSNEGAGGAKGGDLYIIHFINA